MFKNPLKTQIEQLNNDLALAQRSSSTFEKLNAENILQIQYLKQNIEQQQQKFQTEKQTLFSPTKSKFTFCLKKLFNISKKMKFYSLKFLNKKR